MANWADIVFLDSFLFDSILRTSSRGRSNCNFLVDLLLATIQNILKFSFAQSQLIHNWNRYQQNIYGKSNQRFSKSTWKNQSDGWKQILKAYSEPCLISKMKLFAKKVIHIFVKKSILDVWQSCHYTSGFCARYFAKCLNSECCLRKEIDLAFHIGSYCITRHKYYGKSIFLVRASSSITL